ncbi:MAG TPA: P-loop NTPase, partial [Acidimicrobiales bacterium]|nr:P-loop NTPase [Acidimicrobiales bacterium]
MRRSHRPSSRCSTSFGSNTGHDKLPGIRHVIAVGSGKGGVGKSTVAVNLTLALVRAGSDVGLLDADILGPGAPATLGLPTYHQPETTPEGKAVPAVRHGLKAVSMGLLGGDDNLSILRGPMVAKYLHMFVGGVDWGHLDYLIVDLPPGTGDTQLTLAQSLPLSSHRAAPQHVSLKIARRGLRVFQAVHVPILGVIRNMSSFSCPHCGMGTDVLGKGGGEWMSRQTGVPFLGVIPLEADIVAGGDEGRPIVFDQLGSVAGQAYLTVAAELSGQLEGLPVSTIRPFVWTWATDEEAPAWAENAVQASGSRTTPVGFRRGGPRTLSLLWEDGRRDNVDVRDLRLACHCARCVDELSGRTRLDPTSVRGDVAPRATTSVSNYA